MISFDELLRQARSKPSAAVHKFLNSYEPAAENIYIFVEGTPDQSFYRCLLDSYVRQGQRLFVYNCEGKRNVYDVYTMIVMRYPGAKRVLFFVDKDLDDFTGTAWPVDPRIFVTDYYSIENYVVCPGALTRYLEDFVKMRRFDVEFEPVATRFELELKRFHVVIRSLMSWIIVLRRQGKIVLLSDLRMDSLFSLSSGDIKRVNDINRMEYLSRVTKAVSPPGIWRPVLAVARELRKTEAKRFVRGKFEAWFFVAFVRRLIAELEIVAATSGGSLSIAAPLQESNVTQLLVRVIPPPPPLRTFLDFHLATPESHGEDPQPALLRGVVGRSGVAIRSFFKRFLG